VSFSAIKTWLEGQGATHKVLNGIPKLLKVCRSSLPF